LSTFAVIKPGPITAKNSMIRVRQRLANLIAAFSSWIERRVLWSFRINGNEGS